MTGASVNLLDPAVVEELFQNLLQELGADVVGLHLINLAKIAIEGKLSDSDRSAVQEALGDLLAHANEKSQGPYR